MFGLIIFSLIYGSFRQKYVTRSLQDGPRIGIVQGNISQSLKLRGDEAEDIYQKHLQLSMSLVETSVPELRPDLIVWPETMYPYPIGFYEESLEILQEVARYCQVSMLVGAVTYQVDGETDEIGQKFNSAYYLNSDGVVIGRYDKIHLVPVSEYLPLKNLIPIWESLVYRLSGLEKLYQLTPGRNIEPMSLGDKKFGVLICYESIFPELVRQSTYRGAQFIINISNDGWFKNSAELDQMLVISLFRCVENKVSLVRATNTGISAFVSPLGELKIFTDSIGQYKEIEGTMVSSVPIGPGRTFYSKYGDFFPQGCLVLMSVIILLKILKIT